MQRHVHAQEANVLAISTISRPLTARTDTDTDTNTDTNTVRTDTSANG